MVYWTASRNETTSRLFDPYEVSLVDDGWYVFGYCHSSAEVQMFAVQRVRSVTEAGETFDRPADFRAADLMKGSFRAMRGVGEYDVVLRFGSHAAGWINEKQWHPSQVDEDEPDGNLIVKIHLSDLRDIKRWVMFWGTSCEVLGFTKHHTEHVEAATKASRDAGAIPAASTSCVVTCCVEMT